MASDSSDAEAPLLLNSREPAMGLSEPTGPFYRRRNTSRGRRCGRRSIRRFTRLLCDRVVARTVPKRSDLPEATDDAVL